MSYREGERERWPRESTGSAIQVYGNTQTQKAQWSGPFNIRAKNPTQNIHSERFIMWLPGVASRISTFKSDRPGPYQ